MCQNEAETGDIRVPRLYRRLFVGLAVDPPRWHPRKPTYRNSWQSPCDKHAGGHADKPVGSPSRRVPRTCHMQGCPRVATATHGHVGADDQARRLRRSAAKRAPNFQAGHAGSIPVIRSYRSGIRTTSLGCVSTLPRAPDTPPVPYESPVRRAAEGTF